MRTLAHVFVSFFPSPRLFFWSAVLGAPLRRRLVCRRLGLGASVGLAGPPDGMLPIGVNRFWSGPFLWFYVYYAAAVALFAALLAVVAPHPWWTWSILGSALILFTTYFQVEVSVAINDWYGPFFDLIQNALSRTRQ